MNTDIVIVAARRSPLGGMLGSLSSLAAPQLAAQVIQAVVQDSGIAVEKIDEVFMGCVLPAGLGQAPARQAALLAGLANSTGCTTINKVCGSAMKSIMLAFDSIQSGNGAIKIAGGMESMSNAPYLLPRVRQGLRLGHAKVLDHMFLDGLEDAGEKQLMGVYGEQCADKYQFSREQQDAFAIRSVQRAQRAIQGGEFAAEIVPIEVQNKKETLWIDQDEQPMKAKIEKISQLKPAFRENGSITPANASSISDGAAAVMLTSKNLAQELNCKILARIVAHSSHSQAPAEFTTAPIEAINKVLQKAGWHKDEVDLFEINEAFAVVTMAAIEDLQLNAEKVNVNGGACALGHPIGCTGSRIVVTLIHALRQRGLKKGIAALCIGGGEATALALEITP